VRRDAPVLAALRALDVDEQRRLPRAAEHAQERNRSERWSARSAA